MRLSKYFTLEEMTFSQTAVRNGIDNTPSREVTDSMILLCTNLLDKIREAVGSPIHISSGYRCEELNKAIGGSATSQHCKGEAADITVSGMNTEKLYQFIKSFSFEFDQLIQEFDSWVHISFSANNRKECLRAVKQDGKTVYLKDNDTQDSSIS